MPDWVKTATQTKLFEKFNLKRMLSVIVAKGSETFDLHWSIRFSHQNQRDRLINFNFNTRYVKNSIWNTLVFFLGGGEFWNVQFKLAKTFFQKIIIMFGESSVSTQNHLYK